MESWEKPGLTIQARTVAYMKEKGSITSYDAFRDLDNIRISGTISRLRDMGYIIESKRERKENKWGDMTEYARYRLVYEPDEED